MMDKVQELSNPEEMSCPVRNQGDQAAATCSRWFLARGFFYPEDGGDTFLGNVGSIHKIYTAPHPKRRHSSNIETIAQFQHILEHEMWEPVFKNKDTNYKFNSFLYVFLNIFQASFPI
jgi:hypothetical protein